MAEYTPTALDRRLADFYAQQRGLRSAAAAESLTGVGEALQGRPYQWGQGGYLPESSGDEVEQKTKLLELMGKLDAIDERRESSQLQYDREIRSQQLDALRLMVSIYESQGDWSSASRVANINRITSQTNQVFDSLGQYGWMANKDILASSRAGGSYDDAATALQGTLGDFRQYDQISPSDTSPAANRVKEEFAATLQNVIMSEPNPLLRAGLIDEMSRRHGPSSSAWQWLDGDATSTELNTRLREALEAKTAAQKYDAQATGEGGELHALAMGLSGGGNPDLLRSIYGVINDLGNEPHVQAGSTLTGEAPPPTASLAEKKLMLKLPAKVHTQLMLTEI